MGNYSPKIDLVFRKLFGDEESKDILLSLINGVIETPLLTDLTIKNPYSLAANVGDKTNILDIKAVDQDGVWYDIEMQVGELGMYGKRALYYLSKMYVDQLTEGVDYSTLNKTIGIHLIDFDYFHDARYRRHFVFKDMETNEYIEHLSYQQLYFVELIKFRKDWSELGTLLDRWIAFLNKAQSLSRTTLPPELMAQPEIVKAMQRLETMSYTPLEQELYEGELKRRLTDREAIRTSEEKGRKEGRQAGIIEGRHEGILEGRQDGILEGRKEGLNEALQRLLASGMTASDAKRILGIE
jgi:predicted transposase/invertase (TIGR01784 family)